MLFLLCVGVNMENIKTTEYVEEYALSHSIESVRIDRANALNKFFTKYNSPLIGKEKEFIEIADKYELDYRLVPAIAGMESTLCKKIPHQSNNCWGWGVYGNNVIRFESFEAGAEEVAKGLAQNYVDKGLDTPERIAPVYTPPNPGNWSRGVRFFMNEITIHSAEPKTNKSS